MALPIYGTSPRGSNAVSWTLVVAVITWGERVGGSPARRRTISEPACERLGVATFELVQVLLPEAEVAKPVGRVVAVSQIVQQVRAGPPDAKQVFVAERSSVHRIWGVREVRELRFAVFDLGTVMPRRLPWPAGPAKQEHQPAG